jgi:hypothetical protein
MRNKQKENELIEKRNKACKEANKYEAQIKKSSGMKLQHFFRQLF